MKYVPTIGLEIHAELKTQTKMFCNSANDPDEKRPNVNICPVCMAHPGTLPVINKEAVRHVLLIGKALGGTIADFTEFDRKNYFYPDIPKGYQISQYQYPLVSGGSLNGVVITRVHLEEDTARSIHVSSEPQNDADSTQNNAESIQRPSAFSPRESATLVDFNRAGVPLMELVTEPVITSSKQAGVFARELQLLLRYLGASEANMEKGQLRVEANVSLASTNHKSQITNHKQNINSKTEIQNIKLGTKVEIKNINSFRAVERAIEYEIKRQSEALERGEKIIQETRGWNDAKQETFSQRVKEGAADYRYFPDPDLPKLKISEVEEFKNLELPELPWEKRARYKKEYGIKDEDIESFVTNGTLALFFEDVAAALGGAKEKIKLASNYITSDIVGLMKNLDLISLPPPHNFAELINMVAAGEISSRNAKDILALILSASGGNPREIAEENNLFQTNNESAVTTIIEKVLAEHADAAESYKKGKESALQFLIGEAMKESRGSANPQVLAKLFKQKLK